MRAFEFYQQNNLLEQASANAKKEIQSIIQGVKQNPQNASIVAKKLAAFNDAADKIIAASNKAQKQPSKNKIIANAAPPVESLDEATNTGQAEKEALELSSKMDTILKSSNVSPETKKELLALIAEVKDNAFIEGGEGERTANKEFIDNITTKILPRLAEKIYKELEKISTVTAFDPPSADGSGLPTKLAKQITAKQEKNLGAIQGKIVSGLSGVFSKIKDSAILEGPASREAVTQLLNDFIDGVVDFGEVLKLKSGNIDKMLRDQIKEQKKSPEYSKAFEEVRDALYNTVIDIGQGTNMGPGELGLALILKPASKAGKGDLGYGDQTIELKGSRDPKSGARLGLEMGKTARLDSDYQRLLDEYFDGKVPYAYPTKTKTGKQSKTSLNLTTKGIDVLNQLIAKRPGFDTKAFLVDCILLTLEDSEKYRKIVEGHKGLDKAINADGTIDFNNWIKELTLVQYELYGGKEAGKEQFKTIMVFSPTSSNFRVVKNAKEFGAAIDDGQSGKDNGIVLSGGLSFNLDKFQKTPQVGIA